MGTYRLLHIIVIVEHEVLHHKPRPQGVRGDGPCAKRHKNISPATSSKRAQQEGLAQGSNEKIQDTEIGCDLSNTEA